MKAGFISFCDDHYVPLMRVLVDGLEKKSTYPIEVYGVGMQGNPFKNPNVIYRDMSLNLPDSCNHQYCFTTYAKLYGSLHTEFEHAVMLDADMIPNINVDELVQFAMASEKEHPLNAGHGKDPENQVEAMKKLGVGGKSMPYVHATYCTSKQAKPFWAEALSYIHHFVEDEDYWICDETLINCLLWKHGIREQMSTFDPFYEEFKLYKQGKSYLDGPLAGYYEGRHLTYHVFHGCKNAEEARSISEELDRLPIMETTKRKLEIVRY